MNQMEPRQSAVHRPPVPTDVNHLWTALWSPPVPVVLDVRDEDSFRRGHIEGSISAPESNATALVRRIQECDQAVLVCSDGRLSETVARMMGVCGFPAVTFLKGGIDAWRLAKKPLMETQRSGEERQSLPSHDPERLGPIGEVFRHLTPRIFIAGLVLGAALLAIVALIFCD